MIKMNTCIYCGGSNKKFCKAHILPRSLGAFENQPTLLDKVCAECDTEIGKSEDQFTHNGLAALLRPQIGLVADEHKSPFERRYAGQGPIDMKIKYLDTDGVLLKPTGDKDSNKLPLAIILPQLHVIYTDGNKRCTRINPESFTSAEVLRVIGKTIPKQIVVFGVTNEEYEHICDAFRQAGIPLSGEQQVSPPTDRTVIPVVTRGTFSYDKRYFQAIAKIAFHYYLGMNLDNCYLNGSEDVFNPLRQFIRYGNGSPESFVIEKKGYFIDDFRIGWKPPFYGHIFLAEVSNKCIRVKAQFFVGPDIDPPYYEVLLCQKPFIINIQPTIFGHNYVYIEPNKRKQYAGTMHQLGVNNRIIIPSRFR
jgi:hypothetical protein